MTDKIFASLNKYYEEYKAGRGSDHMKRVLSSVIIYNIYKYINVDDMKINDQITDKLNDITHITPITDLTQHLYLNGIRQAHRKIGRAHV